MLAFAIDTTHPQPEHPQEGQNADLGRYMEYQRKLNHDRIIYHSLDHAKSDLQQKIKALAGDAEKLKDYLQKSFPLSHHFADSETILLMLRKLINGQNDSLNWYRMNSYYHALVYDCIKRFIALYNQLIQESTEGSVDYKLSEGVEIDFDDWTHLHFPDWDFHIGKKMSSTPYPFTRRNETIEEAIDKEMKSGNSREESLKAIMDEYEIDETSIKVISNKKIDKSALEMFHTSVENPLYESLTETDGEDWETEEGETVMDQIYFLAARLKYGESETMDPSLLPN